MNDNLLISCFSEKYPIYHYINNFNLKINILKKYLSLYEKEPFHTFFKKIFLKYLNVKIRIIKLISIIKNYKINYITDFRLELDFWSKIKNQLYKENIFLIVSRNKLLSMSG